MLKDHSISGKWNKVHTPIFLIQGLNDGLFDGNEAIFRKEITESKDPAKTRAQLVADYREKFANPYKAAELGYVDEVILPEETRPQLCRALQMLRNKRQEVPQRKHGNIPL